MTINNILRAHKRWRVARDRYFKSLSDPRLEEHREMLKVVMLNDLDAALQALKDYRLHRIREQETQSVPNSSS